MKINDALYGEFEINEAVLIELLNSNTLTRLKGISMAGFYPAYPELSDAKNNRYDHSVGVFLLLRKFNASIEEQIAGLIHDVSHTAFSHTVDYIKENIKDQQNQNTQDDGHEDFIKKSEIKDILEKYHFDIDYILDDKNFTLKENNAPDICADRIDYSLRQAFVCYNFVNKEGKDYIVNSLVNHNGTFVMKDFDSAKFFAELFWDMDEKYYSGMQTAIMFGISGKLFQVAVEKNYLTLEDFYNNDDNTVIEKLKRYLDKDKELKMYYDYLNLPIEYFENNKENYIRHIFCKVRKINPQFLTDDKKLLRVSNLDKEFDNKMKTYSKIKEYFVQRKA